MTTDRLYVLIQHAACWISLIKQLICGGHSPCSDAGEVTAAADLASWKEIWGSGWTFEADLFGKQSIKAFHYSEVQRGHSLSLYNGILIHMHLHWQGTKSIVWQACSLLPRINYCQRNTVSIDLLFKRLLSVAALCWVNFSKHNRYGCYCSFWSETIHIIVWYLA